jgi:hypothetical protein
LTLALFERSAEAIKLHQELMETPVGATVTYARLADAIGKPVTGSTSALRTARMLAQREDRMVFSCLRAQGLRRLDDEGIVELASVETLGVRRHARRVGRKLAVADFLQLKQTSQMRAIAIASVLAVIADMSREQSIKKVAFAASGRASELPIRDTLKAIGL